MAVDLDLRATAAQGHDGQDLRHDALGREAGESHSAAAGSQARGHAGSTGRADGARGSRACAARDSTTADAARRERAARGDGRAAARAAQGDGAAAPAAEREAQDRGLQADGRRQRQDGRERGPL
ncbi:MAG: hypothetical protein ACXVFT_23890, partial [Solirubrobacteraceae bacterium]